MSQANGIDYLKDKSSALVTQLKELTTAEIRAKARWDFHVKNIKGKTRAQLIQACIEAQALTLFGAKPRQ